MGFLARHAQRIVPGQRVAVQQRVGKGLSQPRPLCNGDLHKTPGQQLPVVRRGGGGGGQDGCALAGVWPRAAQALGQRAAAALEQGLGPVGGLGGPCVCGAQCSTSTGNLLREMIDLVCEPNTNSPSAPRPCVTITIMSQPAFSASSMMALSTE